MKISTKGRYGLRILLDVALHQEEGPVSLRDVSRRQAISQKYLWQVISPLKAAGLLSATRGSRGGYVLARSLEEISIRDIVNILEGPVSVVACVRDPKTCDRSVSCTAREAWVEIENKLNDVMSGITLKDLIQRHKVQEARGGQSYAI
jgi:Rrf2 family protein